MDPGARGGLRLIRTETLETDTFFEIENLHFEDNVGRPAIRSVVRHPGAVVVVPVHEGNILLIRQYRAAVDRELLELPAGKLDVEGEQLETAAARECAEEIGYRPTTLQRLVSFLNSPGFTDEASTVFVASGLEFVGREPDGPEEVFSEVVSVAVGEIGDLLLSGEIEDGKSLIGLMAYLQLLHDETHEPRPTD